jgi:hypothetical protein
MKSRPKSKASKNDTSSNAFDSLDEEEDAFLAALMKYGFAAIAEASKEAEKLGIPIVKAEGTNLVRIHPDGTKEIIKEIPQSVKKYPKMFKLKY